MYRDGQQQTPLKVEKEIVRKMDQVVEWGFPIGKIDWKIMMKGLLNNKVIYLCVTHIFASED